MEIEICLGSASFASHQAIVTVPEEKVILAFSSLVYPTEHLIVTVRKSESEKYFRCKDGKVDITEFCDTAGLIEITAILETRGHSAKIWQIEPLIVKELFGSFDTIPELVAIRQELETVKKALIEITEV